MDDRATDINDVSPCSLAHMVGQRNVVAQVAVGLEAAWADGKKFDSALLVGPPGVGKSALAHIIAQEMASQLHEVLGQAIRTPGDLNALLLAAQDRDVVHIDEAHELRKQYQTSLYLALDRRRVPLQGGKSGHGPQSIPLSDFTVLLSTTDEYSLLQPLRDRMKLVLRFDFYAVEDLAILVRQRSQALRWQVDEELFALIAQRARGTPRLALRLLHSSRRVARASCETTITLQHLERACLLEGIDSLGLGPTEQQYLRILAEGATRLNILASRLGLPARTINEVTEPFLLRAGLIFKDHQGLRELTALGREHVFRFERLRPLLKWLGCSVFRGLGFTSFKKRACFPRLSIVCRIGVQFTSKSCKKCVSKYDGGIAVSTVDPCCSMRVVSAPALGNRSPNRKPRKYRPLFIP
jgi:Holliday junction DNA helicase RuvB